MDTSGYTTSCRWSFERIISWLLFLHAYSASMSVWHYRTANMGATPKRTTVTGCTACPWLRTMRKGLSGHFLTLGTQTYLKIWLWNGVPCCHLLNCGVSQKSKWLASWWAWHWRSSSWLLTSWRGTRKDLCSPPHPITSDLWLCWPAQQQMKFPLKRN